MLRDPKPPFHLSPGVNAHAESALGRFGDNNVLLMSSNVWGARSIIRHHRRALALV